MTTASTKPIPATQFLRPFGVPVPTWMDAPADLADLAHAVIGQGYQFHVEELVAVEQNITMRTVSMTVHNKATEEDVDVELCPNGPEVRPAFERLIRRMHAKLFPNEPRDPAAAFSGDPGG